MTVGDTPDERTEFSPDDIDMIHLRGRVALRAAVDNDVPELLRNVSAVTKLYGAFANYQMVVFWVQDTVEYLGLKHDDDSRVSFYNAETGEVAYNTDGMSKEAAWSMRMLTTYAAGSQDTFLALLRSVPPKEFISHIQVLLDVLVANIRAYNEIKLHNESNDQARGDLRWLR